MYCLCHLWSHAAYMLGWPLEPFESEQAESEALAACRANTTVVNSIRGSKHGVQAMLLAALFENPQLRRLFFERPSYPDVQIQIKPVTVDTLAELAFQAQQLPASLLVAPDTHKGVRAQVRVTRCDLKAPGSLLRVAHADGLLVPSVSLHLLLRAQKLEALTLALVISEYCGTYRERPDFMAGHCSGQPRLTSCEALAAYVAALPKGTRGRARLADALKLAFDNSASPRETAIAVLLALPRAVGGAGIGRPLLNEPVTLSPEAARLAGCKAIKPDFLWPEQRLCLQYQSSYFHHDQEALQADNNRAAALEQEGYRCLQITNQQVASPEQFALLAGRIAALLGLKQAPLKPDDERFRTAHQAVMGAHFLW